MTIRPASLADAPAIAQLHTRSWQTTYHGILRDDFLQDALPENRRALWHARLSESERSDQIVLVDDQDGVVRGFACAFLDADPEWGCLVDNLHVAPELKGQGLGTQLMTAVAQRACSARPDGRLHLWVYEQNLPARCFYERLGGIITERHAELGPDGSPVNVVRYGWSELSGLTGRFTTK